jgi:hypothetical protein
MAVVQISRIQQRRGKKNSGTGLPQLASGEIAWCVDTQELFIGNGSVAEGAPYVGNTKLLSEHDDILTFIDKYQYAKFDASIQTGVNSNFPILQTVQQVLDRTVTSENFGVLGDSVTDDTSAIQRAIDQLFLNPSTQGLERTRVRLIFGPGIYKITGTLYIPSYATIMGAGKEKTIFSFTNNGSMIQFTDDRSTPDERSTLGIYTTNLNQARFISITGVTFTTTASTKVGWQMDAVRDSVFTDITINGAWEHPVNDVMTPYADSRAIEMNVLSEVVTCERNVFRDVELSNFAYGVWSDMDISNNKFNDCYFHDLYQGFVFGFGADLNSPGIEYGPRNTVIKDSQFYKIYRQGVLVYNGSNNAVIENKFADVGNGTLGNGFATYAHIDFRSMSTLGIGNSAINNQFDREDEMEIGNNYISTPYVPTVNGYGLHDSRTLKQVEVSYLPAYATNPIIRLPVPIKLQSIVQGHSTIGYEITYSYRSATQTQSRFGKLLINADVANNTIQIVDEYEYTGPSSRDANLEFKAQFINTDSSSGTDTLGIYYRNATIGDTAFMIYTYKALSFNQIV